MNENFQANFDIYIPRGSKGPLHKRLGALVFLTGLSLFMALPEITFAANMNYLAENAPGFIDKTKAQYGEMVNIAALLHDYDDKLILAVIVVESEGNEVATSHKGAQGLMQLMPATAKAMGAKDPKEPFQNILAGTKYLKSLENDYGFDSPQEALVAYNMGPSRAHRWLSQYPATDYEYVQKVMYVYNVLAEEEKADKRLAEALDTKMKEDAAIASAPKPLLTRPRVLSLAPFPMTLPSARKDEVQEGK